MYKKNEHKSILRHKGRSKGTMNITASSSDSDLNINDMTYGDHDNANPTVGVSSISPSKRVSSSNPLHGSGVNEVFDDDVSTIDTLTSASGMQLKMSNRRGKVEKHDEISLNDFNTESNPQPPSDTLPTKTIRFSNLDTKEVLDRKRDAKSFKRQMILNQEMESRGRKVSRFDLMKRNRMSISFIGKGSLLDTDQDRFDTSEVNEGFDDIDGHTDSRTIDYDHIEKVKKTKDGFLKDVKSKIQKTTKNNRLNRVYSPALIVNLTEAIRDDDLFDVLNILDQNSYFSLNKLDKNNLSLLHHAAIHNRDIIARELLKRGACVDVIELHVKATPLHAAARMNSADIAHVLLARCADVNKRTTGGMTPLHISARRGHVEVTRVLLRLGKADVFALDKDYCTPLHLAAVKGSMGVCKLLVDHGADIRAKDGGSHTPLMKAVMNGHNGLIDLLLEKARNTDIPVLSYLMDEDNESNTPLHLAVLKRKTEVIQRLFDEGVDVNVRKKNGMTPIHIAAMNGATTTVMQLIENGADIDMKDAEGMTPLHRAAVYNRVESMALLIHEGAMIDDMDDNGFTPLLCAAWKGHVPAGELLLTRGANVYVFDVHHKSPLHWAAEMDHLGFLEFLLKHGGYDLRNEIDENDQTALHYAAESGNVDMIKLLLKYEAEGDVRDVLCKTPVHIASQAGFVNCVEQLLDHTPMLLNEDDCDGMTPLLTSCFYGRHEMVRKLLKMGADISNVNDENRTALMLAAINDHVETMSILIEHNCDIHAIDKERNTALHVCCDAGHIAAANLLIRAGADQSASNNEGFTPLELAIEREQGEIAAAIIKSKDWRIAMQSRDELMTSPMKALIEKLPDVALLVMDRCVHKTYKNTQSSSYCVKYEYQYVDPGPDDESTKVNEYRYFAIRTMCQFGREKLLAHELSQSILKRKWNRFGRLFYYMDLLFYIMFLVSMTLYTGLYPSWADQYRIHPPSDPTVPPTNPSSTTPGPVDSSSVGASDSYPACPYFNLTEHPFLANYFYYYAPTDSFYFVNTTPAIISYIVLTYCVTVIMGELSEIYVVRLKYFTDFTNAIDWVNLGTATIFVYPPGKLLCSYNWISGVIAIFFSWIKFILYFKGFKTTGLYVLMFMETLSSLLKAMSVYIMFVVSFSVTFEICLRKIYRFSDNTYSFLSVITMMLGEFNKDDIFNEDVSLKPYGVTVYILFLAFLFLMPMVLNNLTIGIAVGDIDEIQKKAFIKRNSIQADYVYHLEGKFPLWLQRFLYQPEFMIKVTKNKVRFLQWFFPKEDAAFVETDEKSAPRNAEHVLDELRKHKAMMSTLKLMIKQQGDILRRVADKEGVLAKSQDLDTLEELYDDPPDDQDDGDNPTSSVV
ncbi:transient receptor potential cation channel subfamily A member 1-like [Lytechinus pictus]|uniref:transient receptor potential cation channel subfamily A member 1-like n=1 Tax=Lytechinus pictus TaxID=7653 RepID=UPI0030B9FEAD